MNGNHIGAVPQKILVYYLKSYCKFISNNYLPILSECSDVVALNTSDMLPPDLLDSLTPFTHSLQAINKDNSKFLSPDFLQQMKPMNNLGSSFFSLSLLPSSPFFLPFLSPFNILLSPAFLSSHLLLALLLPPPSPSTYLLPPYLPLSFPHCLVG